MLVLLLLISTVTCEWVEISQNHYKKEPPRKALQQGFEIEREGINDDFNNVRNQSVVEKQWNKAVIDRVINMGNIRRVQVPSVKTTSIKSRTGEDHIKHDTKIKPNEDNLNNRHHSHKPFNEVAVPLNNLKISRIRLPTETINSAQMINHNAENSHDLSPKNSANRRKITINKEQNSHNTDADIKIIHRIPETEKRNEDIRNNNDQFYDRKKTFGNYQKITNTGQNKVISINDAQNKPFYGSSSTPISKPMDIEFKNIENQDFGKSDGEDYFKEVILRNDEFSNTSFPSRPKFHITKLDMPPEYTNQYTTEFYQHASQSKTSLRPDEGINFPKSTDEENFNKINGNREETFHGSEEISNRTKGEAVSGMWKLMKVVTDTIYKNTHRSFKSKIKYLENLKTTIITSIEEHIDTMWPDDMEHRSMKRSIRTAEARGHLEFPSSESTLMTISFLTFAVFLIKLVLQVIHTYKNKTMMVTPAMVAAVGRAAAAIRAKHEK